MKLLLADDHPLTRAGIAEFIRQDPSFELVAETEDGVKAWERIQELKPDVALLDIRMPSMDGIAIARRIKEEGLPTLPLMLTSYDARQYILASLRAGARGFVLKTAGPDELRTAITTVAKGGVYLDPEAAATMVSDDFVPGQLSAREREILLLSGKGLSSKEVAGRLDIGDRTVETHLESIYGKLGSRNKTEALLLALKHGIVTLDELLRPLPPNDPSPASAPSPDDPSPALRATSP